MNSWKVILATLVIFGAGVVTGAMVIARFTPPPVPAPAPPPHVQVEKKEQQQQTDLLHRMDKQLELTTDQHKKLEKVFKESQKRSKGIRDQIAPQLRGEVERVRGEIMAELTPDQQKKFESLPHTTSLNIRKPEKNEDDIRMKKPRGKKGANTNAPANNLPAKVESE